MNATYRAIELSGPGKFSEVRKPLLDPAPNQVRIRVEACGVCHSDAATVEGLFPIDWPEPFGLVLIEAMANGTPVIAFGRGSVPEIIDHGITGFIVDSVDEAVAAIPLAKALDRGTIRRRFEEQFSVECMARGYVALYGEVLRRGTVGAVLSSAATAHAMANAA